MFSNQQCITMYRPHNVSFFPIKLSYFPSFFLPSYIPSFLPSSLPFFLPSFPSFNNFCHSVLLIIFYDIYTFLSFFPTYLSPLSCSANVLNVIQCGVSWLGHIFFIYLTRPHHLNQRFPFHLPVNKVWENIINKTIKTYNKIYLKRIK